MMIGYAAGALEHLKILHIQWLSQLWAAVDAKVAMESGELAEFCCTPVPVMGFWPNAAVIMCVKTLCDKHKRSPVPPTIKDAFGKVVSLRVCGCPYLKTLVGISTENWGAVWLWNHDQMQLAGMPFHTCGGSDDTHKRKSTTRQNT